MSRNPVVPFQRTDGPLRVAIVADDPIAREGLASMLESTGEAVIASDLDTAEVALVDSGADPGRTSACLERIDSLDLPALALVADEAQAPHALAAGARGAVLRRAQGASLVAALVAVRHGLTVLDAGFAPRAVRARVGAAADLGPEELTSREREVLQLLAGGLSNRRIAAALGISEHTAKFHVNSILAKLDADTRTEAVVLALRHGLLIL